MPLLAVGLGVIAAQFLHTVRDRSTWPFCSYNMFNRTVPQRMSHFRIQLREGPVLREPMEVWGMLPLEHFRVVSIFKLVYLWNEDDEVKREFASCMLRRINASPWGSFDQVHAPPRPSSAAGFTGFDLFRVTIDLKDYDPMRGGPVHQPILVYRHLEPRCMPSSLVSETALAGSP